MENNILKLLDGRPLTLLAEKSGVHRNSLRSYINGAAPRLDNAYKIARALGVPIYDVWPDFTSEK